MRRIKKHFSKKTTQVIRKPNRWMKPSLVLGSVLFCAAALTAAPFAYNTSLRVSPEVSGTGDSQ